MKLNLKRPLAFFDLETTGVNIASDRIVEISILKIQPDAQEEIRTIRIHPGIAIPLEASLIHGIYDADIADAPKFKEVARDIAQFLVDVDLAGYNSNRFDIPILMEEFLRAGIDFDLHDRRLVDVQNIFHQMEQRTLKAAYKFYCGKSIENAHAAEGDAKATYQILLAQLDRYQHTAWEDKIGRISTPVQNDIDALHAFTNLNKPVDFAGRMVYNEDGIEIFNFGKHKGRSIEEVFGTEPSYYAWMQHGDFPLYTKRCLEKIWTRWTHKKNQAQKSTATTRPPRGIEAKKSIPKDPKEALQPIDDGMLDQLKKKFSK